MISDHHANFEVSDVTRGGARSFLRFYSMGSPGWGKKFGCQNFSLIILHPVIGHFFLVSPVLGHSGHSTMWLLASRDITVVVAERKKISRALGFDKMALLVEDFFCLQILSCPKTTSPNLTKLWAASNCVWKRRPPDFKTTTHQTTKRIRSMAEAQM